jgi:hypothetical protein
MLVNCVGEKIHGGIPCWTVGWRDACVWALAEEELVEHMNIMAEPDASRWLFTMIDSISHA